MSEWRSAVVDRLSLARVARAFAGLSLAGLLLTITVVAVVAMSAESVGRKTWGSYFAMEQAMAYGTPVAVTFAGLSVLGGFAVVYTVAEDANTERTD